MSHFVIGVIMEKEKAENDLEGTISNLQTPFQESPML